jgi:predicted nucleotidyltransferase
MPIMDARLKLIWSCPKRSLDYALVTQEQIQEYSDRIAAEFKPERIILFGSYAYGTPTANSDVDLLVVMPFEGHPARKALHILNTIDPPFAIDLLVHSPEELRQRLAWNDFFLREIVEQGRELYAATHYGVGRQSRGGCLEEL